LQKGAKRDRGGEGGIFYLAVARCFRSNIEYDKLNEGAADSEVSEREESEREERGRREGGGSSAAAYLLQRDAKGYFQYLRWHGRGKKQGIGK
jgi:hypothetical protein